MSKLPSDSVLDAVNLLTNPAATNHRVTVTVAAELDFRPQRLFTSNASWTKPADMTTFEVTAPEQADPDNMTCVPGHGCGPQSYGTPEATDPDISTARCANRKCLDDVDFDALPEVDFSNTQKEALLETARKADVYGAPSLKDKFTQDLIDAFGAIDFDTAALGYVDYSNAQRDALRIDVRGGHGGYGGGFGR